MPNVDEVLEGAREAITVRRVYGDPIEGGGVTIVPAAAIRGGGGGGGDSDGNGGVGFGVQARPAGAWVLHDGEATWKPAVDYSRIAVLALVVVLAFALRRR